jgi:hypothetical protein
MKCAGCWAICKLQGMTDCKATCGKCEDVGVDKGTVSQMAQNASDVFAIAAGNTLEM